MRRKFSAAEIKPEQGNQVPQKGLREGENKSLSREQGRRGKSNEKEGVGLVSGCRNLGLWYL